MTTYSYILLIILCLSLVLFLRYCWRIIKSLTNNRIEARKENKRNLFPLVCAGSYISGYGEEGVSASIDINHFYTPEGLEINPKVYKQFVVTGNSMSLCGIFDKNLLFVSKEFSTNNLIDFPKILVIKRRDAHSKEIQFKVRRTWTRCAITDDLSIILKQIIESNKFKNVLSADECPTKKELIDDFFDIRLKRYKENFPDAENEKSEFHDIIISTTWHTDNEKGVRFSIHPIKDIVGIVEYSFTVPQNLLN